MAEDSSLLLAGRGHVSHMKGAALIVLLFCVVAMAAGLLLPPYLRSTLFDQPQTYDRPSGGAAQERWKPKRDQMVSRMERFRAFSLWVGLPLAVLCVLALALG